MDLKFASCFFSPLGKLAVGAIYSANVFFFIFVMVNFLDPVA